MKALIEYYAGALTRGRFSLISFAIQPLSFIFIVYVVSGGRFLNTALGGAIVSFIVGVGIADLAIELVGMKTRSRFYDIIMSLPGSGWKKALGISIGMSVPAFPYVLLLTVLLLARLGVRALPGMVLGVVSLWLWGAGIGFLLGVRMKEPVRTMRLSNILVTGLTVFPPVYYPLNILPEKLARVLIFFPTVSASQVLSGAGGSAPLITTLLWGILGLVFLLKFAGIEEGVSLIKGTRKINSLRKSEKNEKLIVEQRSTGVQWFLWAWGQVGGCKMKKGTGYLLNSLLISFLPWPVLWLISFFYFGGYNTEISKFSFTWLLSALASFLMVSAVLVFNLARLIERLGYSKGDVVRIHEILNENSKNLNLLKTVRESIHYHFSFWGAYVTVSLVYGPIKSALFLISIIAWVIILSSIMLPLFIFAVGIPAFLYFASQREFKRINDLFAWVIEVSIASLALLGFLRFIALHGAIPPEYLGVSELRNLLQLAGDSTVFRGLFLLSFLGILSGITGYLGAKRSKLAVVVLFAIGIMSIFTDVHLLGLLFY